MRRAIFLKVMAAGYGLVRPPADCDTFSGLALRLWGTPYTGGANVSTPARGHRHREFHTGRRGRPYRMKKSSAASTLSS